MTLATPVAPPVAAALGEIDLDRAVELTCEVCRIPSVLGEEGALAAFLADTMSGAGFDAVRLQPALRDRPNAIGEVTFGSGGPRVVMTGHMDTKPVSRGWTKAEPFSGTVVDGAVYGHGVMDMKAALACQIVAIEAVARAAEVNPRTYAGTLAMAAVADHMGGQAGSIAYFTEHAADLCVLGELTDNHICLGHRGRYYFDVTTRGLSAHSCYKHDAVNAIVLAAPVVLALEASRLLPELDDEVSALFGPETFVVPGRIYGGLPPGGPSMIPDECVIRVDCRPQPGVTVGQVREEIERCLAEAGQLEPRLAASLDLVDVRAGYLAQPSDKVVQLMIDAVTQVGAGSLELVTEDWLGDTSSFGQDVPTVIYGPGGAPVYCPDEHLSIGDIHQATKVYAAYAALALSQDPTERTGP